MKSSFSMKCYFGAFYGGFIVVVGNYCVQVILMMCNQSGLCHDHSSENKRVTRWPGEGERRG